MTILLLTIDFQNVLWSDKSMTYPENIFVTDAARNFFADSALEAKTHGTSDLFLLIEKEKVQLSLKERRTGKMLAFEKVLAQGNKISGWKDLLENTSSQSRILRNYEFSKVTACITSKEYTLVPEALFKNGDEIIYFRKNFSFTPQTIIRSQHVSTLDLHVIFGIDNDLEKEINHLFQDAQIFHHSQAILSDLGMHGIKENGKQIKVNIQSDMIDILVSENKKIILLNSFNWKTQEDILYYTLFVCEQLEINPAHLNLVVTGDIQPDSALMSLLKSYLYDVTIAEKPSSLSSGISDLDFPYNQFALLHNLSLCE